MRHPFTAEDVAEAMHEVWGQKIYYVNADKLIQALWDSAVARGAVQQTGSFVKPTEISGYFIKLPENGPKPNVGFSVLKLPEDKT